MWLHVGCGCGCGCDCGCGLKHSCRHPCAPHLGPACRRGAHTFFLRQGEVPRWGGYTVNLIHYEDAAGLCLAVLQASRHARAMCCFQWASSCAPGQLWLLVMFVREDLPSMRSDAACAANACVQHKHHIICCRHPMQGRGNDGSNYRGRTFLGCDGNPITFEVCTRMTVLACDCIYPQPGGQPLPLAQWSIGVAAVRGNQPAPLPPLAASQDMMAATLASGAFQGSYKFTGPEGPVKGKRMSNEATRAQLQVGHTRRRSARRAARPPLGSKVVLGSRVGGHSLPTAPRPWTLLQAAQPCNPALCCSSPSQWQPKYESYDSFMRQNKARDWYAEQEAAAVAGMPHA